MKKFLRIRFILQNITTMIGRIPEADLDYEEVGYLEDSLQFVDVIKEALQERLKRDGDLVKQFNQKREENELKTEYFIQTLKGWSNAIRKRRRTKEKIC